MIIMLFGIGEQWIRLKKEVMQELFKSATRLKQPLHEISYMFACEKVGQDKHNKQKQTVML